jgi:hypothetical protein
MSQESLDLEARVAALEAARATKGARRHVSRRRLAVLLIAVSLAAPAVVLASHRFTDVPTTNTFHNQISILADAGITRGCNPPANTLYCPADPVRRDQMAAFIIRSAGRMTQTAFDFPAVVDGSPFASLTVKTEGRAWIDARAAFYFLTNETLTTPDFPCENAVDIFIDGMNDFNARVWGRANANPATADWVVTPAAGEWAIAVDAGTHTVQLRWAEGSGSCDMSVGRGTFSAEVVPFDATTAGTPALPTDGGPAGGGSKSSGR